MKWYSNLMKHIYSWNVNGIRAWHRKDGLAWLEKVKPDILCVQETKAHPDQLSAELRTPYGYVSYFDHSKTKKGYSGVAIYSRVKPEKIQEGLGVEAYDQEGRLLTAFFKDFVLINCYFPNGGGGPSRLAYKLEFYDLFLSYVEHIRKTYQNIIICGDINTAHEAIDLARPKENEKNTGFLPEERAWLDEVLARGYVDTFRHIHPDAKGAYTYWDMKTFARERNVGWRIDYFLISPPLTTRLKKAQIHNDVFGSDHCPISITLDI